MRYWHEIETGQEFRTGSLKVSHEEILDFATQFDPQPYHLDAEAASQSIFGGLCASGWQVSALMMRLLTDRFREAKLAVLGLDSVPQMRWKNPVFAGDELRATIRVSAKLADSGDSSRGSVVCDVEVENQDARPVIAMTASVWLAKEQAVD